MSGKSNFPLPITIGTQEEMPVGMFNRFKPKTIARSSIILVFIVLAVCLLQRAGFVTRCPLSAKAINQAELLHSSVVDALDEEPCELSDHLLQSQLQTLVFWVAYLPVIFLILAWLTSGTPSTLAFTEPIPPGRRQHLVLCVFKE